MTLRANLEPAILDKLIVLAQYEEFFFKLLKARSLLAILPDRRFGLQSPLATTVIYSSPANVRAAMTDAQESINRLRAELGVKPIPPSVFANAEVFEGRCFKGLEHFCEGVGHDHRVPQ